MWERQLSLIKDNIKYFTMYDEKNVGKVTKIFPKVQAFYASFIIVICQQLQFLTFCYHSCYNIFSPFRLFFFCITQKTIFKFICPKDFPIVKKHTPTQL